VEFWISAENVDPANCQLGQLDLDGNSKNNEIRKKSENTENVGDEKWYQFEAERKIVELVQNFPDSEIQKIFIYDVLTPFFMKDQKFCRNFAP